MRIPQEKAFDVIQFKQDRQAYNYWFRKQFGAGDDEDDTKRIADLLYAAVRLELTPLQRLYFSKYYFEGLTMEEIAQEHGVNKSTVSRTISRARRRVERVLKYADPKLFRIFEQGGSPIKIRQNTHGAQKYKLTHSR